MDDECSIIFSGLFSIIVAGVAYLASIKKYSETTKDIDKTIFVSAITNERAKWRDELRNNTSEFCKLCVDEKVNLGELQQAKTHILLRLNPRSRNDDGAEKHKYDHKITNQIFLIYGNVVSGDKENIQSLVENLQLFVQELLKQEWDKSKKEALSGKVENS